MILIENAPISAAILDMDGVLWRSNEPLCDLKELFFLFTSKKNISFFSKCDYGFPETSKLIPYFKKINFLF